MPRHAQAVDQGTRVTRLAVLVVVWAGGLAAGFYALLGIAARYGCGASSHGLGCTTGGSVVGVVLLVGVIAVVTTVTVLVHGRTPSQTAVLGLAGLVALAGCAVGAHALLNTV
jgi:hypothetical protein